MPASDVLLDPRRIEHAFPATANAITVYLAVSEERAVVDEITGGDEKPGKSGRENIRFMAEGEVKEGGLRCPSPRVRRQGANPFSFDPKFVPPVLKFGANPALMAMTNRLLEILSQKNAAFTGANRGFNRQSTGLSPQQIATFGVLRSVNSGLSAWRHLYRANRAHPEELFYEMLRLGGSLCTFGLEAVASRLPTYEHLDLQASFA